MKLAKAMFEMALSTSKRFIKLSKQVATLTTELYNLVQHVRHLSENVARHEYLLRQANQAYGNIIHEMQEEQVDFSLPDDKKDDGSSKPN